MTGTGLKIKVCGLRDRANVVAVEALRPDFLGFIFVPSSPRYVGPDFDPAVLKALPRHAKTVGVFLNQPLDEIKAAVEKYHFPIVQLHGDETPEFCGALKETFPQLEIIKAFSMHGSFDLHGIVPYNDVANYLLFDTAGTMRGGTGAAFDWNKLSAYRGHRPIFVAGGIGPEHVMALKKLRATLPALFAVDLNSRFETAPGVKSVALLSNFIRDLRT